MSTANRAPATTLARIASRLTQVIVTGDGIDETHVFFDGKLLLPGQIESIALNIDGPKNLITAQLSWKESGEHRAASLFPGIVEVTARGKRLIAICAEDGNLDTLSLLVGLNEQAESEFLNGIESVRVLITPGLLDTKLLWLDGRDESIF